MRYFELKPWPGAKETLAAPAAAGVPARCGNELLRAAWQLPPAARSRLPQNEEGLDDCPQLFVADDIGVWRARSFDCPAAGRVQFESNRDGR